MAQGLTVLTPCEEPSGQTPRDMFRHQAAFEDISVQHMLLAMFPEDI